jgi:hypothetical protein
MGTQQTLHALAHAGLRSSTSAPVAKPTGSSSTKADARAMAILAHAAHQRTTNPVDSAADDARRQGTPNPLWAISVAMAAFFGAAALIMMFD